MSPDAKQVWIFNTLLTGYSTAWNNDFAIFVFTTSFYLFCVQGKRDDWPERWVDRQKALKDNNTHLDLALAMLDSVIFTSLFTSPKAIQKLLGEVIAQPDNINVAGLQLDVEMYDFVSPDTITHYRSFIQARSQRLHQQRSIGRLLFALTSAKKLDRHTPANPENS